MSMHTIERRFNIIELRFLIETLDKVIKEYENQSASSFLIDNVPKAKEVLEKFTKYHSYLKEHIKNWESVIKNKDFEGWSVTDNELYLQGQIGVILPLEDYHVLFFYLDAAKLNNNSYVNNSIISLRDELMKKITFTVNSKYLSDHGIKREIG